jgi:hypothetical protein
MSETGHAKNVSAFELLINFITSLGSIYNPTAVELQLTSLNALLVNAKGSLASIQTEFSGWKISTNQREISYETAQKSLLRSFNSFAVCGADALAVTDVKSFVRKMQGVRAKAKPEPKTAGEVVKTHSASQTSYDNKAEHFAQSISIYEIHPEYKPNEEELRVDSLKNVLADLRAKNTAVNNSTVSLSNSRRDRDAILYGEPNGLVHIAKAVKLYVKSVFGANSPQYKQISGLAFKNMGKNNS